MKSLFVLVALLLVAVAEINTYNILMITVNSRSHKIVFDAVANGLSKNGHKVTVVSSLKEDYVEGSQVTQVLLERTEDTSHMDNSQDLLVEIEYYGRVINELVNKASAFYEDAFIQNLIKNPKDPKTQSPKYDLVIVDAIFNEFCLPLAYHLGVPTILLSPSVLYPQTAWYLSIPHLSSYISSPFVTYPSKMSYTGRMHNTWVSFRVLHAIYFHGYSTLEHIAHELIPNTPTINELLGNVSLLFTNTNPVINSRVSTMPYFIEVGGLHCRPAKKLPKDLETFVNNSGNNGVIYVSINDTLQAKTRNQLVQAFSQLQQNVIWEYAENIEGLSKNVKLVTKAPQQDILGNQKVKLFIGSGSTLDVQESVYHEVPLIGLPFTTHQLKNLGLAANLGFCEHVNVDKLNADNLVSTIKKVLSDKRYEENVKKTSKLFKDRKEEPMESVTFWVEYVIRNNGAHHLKSEAHNTETYEYFLIDTFGTIFTLFTLALILVVVLIVVLTPLLGRPYKGQGAKKKAKSG